MPVVYDHGRGGILCHTSYGTSLKAFNLVMTGDTSHYVYIMFMVYGFINGFFTCGYYTWK